MNIVNTLIEILTIILLGEVLAEFTIGIINSIKSAKTVILNCEKKSE